MMGKYKKKPKEYYKYKGINGELKIDISFDMVKELIKACNDPEFKKNKLKYLKYQGSLEYLEELSNRLKGRKRFGTFEIVLSCPCRPTDGSPQK
jgi:hypothetical protein